MNYEYKIDYIAHVRSAKLPDLISKEGWDLHDWKVIRADGPLNDIYILWRRPIEPKDPYR